MGKCGDITAQQVVKIFLSNGVVVENNQMFPMRHCAQNGRRQILIIEFCHKPPSFLYDFQLLQDTIAQVERLILLIVREEHTTHPSRDRT